MNDRRRLHAEEDPERARYGTVRPDRRDDPRSASILDLQGRAGNQAVAELLGGRASDAARTPVQRDVPKGETDTKGGKTSGAGTMTIPTLDMAVPILSFSQQAGGAGQKKESGGEVTVTLSEADVDARIWQAAASGRHFDLITIALGTSTFTLHDVVISSVNTGSGTVSVGLNFGSMEFGSGS